MLCKDVHLLTARNTMRLAVRFAVNRAELVERSYI